VPMATLRRSPFKASRIEDNSDALGLLPEAVLARADAVYNCKSILISDGCNIALETYEGLYTRILTGRFM
jgi:hypothetical protein